ncbi:MAG: glycosyltransferase family 4 protein [Candidatus Lariskella arthropodorum]
MNTINLITPSIKLGGGMERYICELAERLSHNYNINIYCLKYDGTMFTDNKHITIHQSKMLNRFPRFLKYVLFSIKIYLKTRKKNIPNIATARIFNPTLAIVGGTHQQHNTSMGKRNGIYDHIEIFLEKKHYKNAKQIIAHSPLMISEINNYNLNVDDKISMLFPPINLDKFNFVSYEEKVKFRQKLNLPKDAYLVFIAGTEDPRKGVPEAIKAIQALGKPYFLMIFGKTCKLTLPENAKHFGIVSNIQAYYAAADVILVPSIYEPFGLVVVEALETGRPVILSQNVGANVFTNQYNSILLKNTDENSIVLALKMARQKQWQLDINYISKQKLDWATHIESLLKLL